MSPVRSTQTSLRFALLVILASSFLDSYTYLARGGVFANAQTGNVIFLALDLSDAHWSQASQHVWPILAFVVGVFLATHVRSGKLDGVVPYPIRVTMAVQVVILTVVGFVPASVPHWAVTVPVAFLASLQIELFRSIGELNYMAIATTGNLMRLVEAGYRAFVDGESEYRRAFGVYLSVIGVFAVGATIGAVGTRLLGVHAAWLPAGFLALTLVFFVLDERTGDTA